LCADCNNFKLVTLCCDNADRVIINSERFNTYHQYNLTEIKAD